MEKGPKEAERFKSIRFCHGRRIRELLVSILLCPMRSKNDQLHQEKVTHGGTGDGAEFGDQNVRSKSGKAELDYHDRDYPIVQDNGPVLNQLLSIVFATAAKHPELVQ